MQFLRLNLNRSWFFKTTAGSEIKLDLSKTKYIDSSGLSALLVGQRLCRDTNGTFVICGLQETVKKLISISQLDAVFKITPTLNEAIDLVYMEEIEREI